MEEQRSFYKGALIGALAVLLVGSIIGGVIIICTWFGFTDKVVDKESELKLEEIQSIIEENYLYYDDIDEEALSEGLLKGYVEGLNEPYTEYYDKEETKALFESTSGEFGGIGVQITQDITTKVMSFVKVYDDSPCDKAGFKDGDILYKVNGEEVTGQDLDHVVTKIRGEVGTKVEITVLRGDKLEEYTATATREIIQKQTVEYELSEDGIGYVIVSGFEKVTFSQFEAAITDLTSQGMKGLIIDLRGNPGGNVWTACQMADLILPEGTIVSVKDREGNSKVYKTDEEHQINLPMVLLVDGNSASSSEIFAGAIQDFGVATLVGTTTYGKGIVQTLYELYDGTCLKITTAEYYTPNDRNIHGIGIEPDVVVPYEYDENDPYADNQLEKAIEILKKGM